MVHCTPPQHVPTPPPHHPLPHANASCHGAGTHSPRPGPATLAAASSTPTFATCHRRVPVCLPRLFSACGSCSRSQQVDPRFKRLRHLLTAVTGAAIRARIDKCPVDSRAYAAACAVDQVRRPSASPLALMTACAAAAARQARREAVPAVAEKSSKGTQAHAPRCIIKLHVGITIYISACAAAHANCQRVRTNCVTLPAPS